MLAHIPELIGLEKETEVAMAKANAEMSKQGAIIWMYKKINIDTVNRLVIIEPFKLVYKTPPSLSWL